MIEDAHLPPFRQPLPPTDWPASLCEEMALVLLTFKDLQPGQLLPPYLVMRSPHGKLVADLSPLFASNRKDAIEALCIQAVQKGAHELLLVSETWQACGDEALRWQREHGSLEGYPDKHDVVTISYSTPTDELYAQSVISADRQLGSWVVARERESHGRFTKFFHKARAGDN